MPYYFACYDAMDYIMLYRPNLIQDSETNTSHIDTFDFIINMLFWNMKLILYTNWYKNQHMDADYALINA